MSKLSNKIEIGCEVRPCYVDDKKAVFHRWVYRDDLVISADNYLEPKNMVEVMAQIKVYGYVPTGFDYVCNKTTLLALVELEDGQVEMVDPESIRFADSLTSQFCYCDSKAGYKFDEFDYAPDKEAGTIKKTRRKYDEI